VLDRKIILQDPQTVKQNCQNRGVACDIDRLIELEQQRKQKLAEAEAFNRLANETSKKIGQAADQEERESLKSEGKRLREQKAVAQQIHDELERAILEIQATLPNLAHPDAPVGDDQSNLELKRGAAAIPTFDFPVRDHVDLGEQRDWIDFAGGARTTGSGFYFLKGDLVRLDLALQQFAVHELQQRGFVPTITPDLAQDEILQGIGFMPRGPETQVYSIADRPLSLIGTAEITLGGLYSGQTLMDTDLPIKLCGISHCYRTEAGAAGRASRGLYRVHQFTKVEMFAFVLPEQSEAMHRELLDIECDLFDKLEIPYRVVDTATGDLGGPAYRKFDLEAWMPGRGANGEWGEVTSTSNCTDYQARRLDIRYKIKDRKGTQFVHTLNGTALALSRGLIAILENHQTAAGRVRIPPALQPWLAQPEI